MESNGRENSRLVIADAEAGHIENPAINLAAE